MSDYKLVPIGPTPEMVEAAEDAYMPFGDMEMALRMAVLAAPSVQGEPVGYVRPHHLKMLRYGKVCGITLEDKPDAHNRVTIPLYAAPQPAEQQPAPDVAVLVDALESLLRHAKKMGRTSALYEKARAALAAHRKEASHDNQ